MALDAGVTKEVNVVLDNPLAEHLFETMDCEDQMEWQDTVASIKKRKREDRCRRFQMEAKKALKKAKAKGKPKAAPPPGDGPPPGPGLPQAPAPGPRAYAGHRLDWTDVSCRSCTMVIGQYKYDPGIRDGASWTMRVYDVAGGYWPTGGPRFRNRRTSVVGESEDFPIDWIRQYDSTCACIAR